MSISSTGRSKSEKIGRLVTDVMDACHILDVGRDKLYRLLAAGQIESYRDGRSRKVVIASLENYVARRLAASKKFTRARYLNNPEEPESA